LRFGVFLLQLKIIKYPHPTLRHKSKPLRRVDAELRKFVAAMLEAMYDDRGIGLAANQIDLPYRLFVMNTSSDATDKDGEVVMINPMIIKRSGMAEAEEGCLSLPDVYGNVRRPDKVTIAAYNMAGEEMEYKLGGLLARAVQHETDHLDGVLFVDRLSESGRLSVKESLETLQMQFEGERRRGQIPDDKQIAARLAELESLRT
jgi:peptide deformylase